MPPATLFTGKTLEDAVRKGLEALGVSRAEAMITVIEEGSGGFLGLGARPYRVRIMPRPGGAIREPEERDSRGRRESAPRGGRSERGPRGRSAERSGEPRAERSGEPRAERSGEPRAERGGERGRGRRGGQRGSAPVAAGSGEERRERSPERRGRPDEPRGRGEARGEPARAAENRGEPRGENRREGERRVAERRGPDSSARFERRDGASIEARSLPQTSESPYESDRASAGAEEAMPRLEHIEPASAESSEDALRRRRRRRGRRGGRGRGASRPAEEMMETLPPLAHDESEAPLAEETALGSPRMERVETAMPRAPRLEVHAPREFVEQPMPAREPYREALPVFERSDEPRPDFERNDEPRPEYERNDEPGTEHVRGEAQRPPMEPHVPREPYLRPSESHAVNATAAPANTPGPALSNDALAAEGKRWTEELLHSMGFDATVSSTAAGDRVDVVAEVAADDELLNGPKGEVRQALQHLLNRMVNLGEGSRYHLQLEINDFWKRREEELRELALQLAEQAITNQTEAVTEYLNAQERRIIHVTLREDRRVKTYALGDGMIKRLAVAPADFPEGGRED